METIFAEEAVSEMAVREGVAADRETGPRSRWVEERGRDERRRGKRAVPRSVFRRNDDASNMSPTDIRIGIPWAVDRKLMYFRSMPRVGSRFSFSSSF